MQAFTDIKILCRTVLLVGAGPKGADEITAHATCTVQHTQGTVVFPFRPLQFIPPSGTSTVMSTLAACHEDHDLFVSLQDVISEIRFYSYVES